MPTCRPSRFPADWLDSLTREYHRRPEIKDGWSLPSRSLAELLIGLDPAIAHVSSDLTAANFITAQSAADTDVLATAIASWAATDVAPGDCAVDWWDRFSSDDLHFEQTSIDLLSYGSHPEWHRRARTGHVPPAAYLPRPAGGRCWAGTARQAADIHPGPAANRRQAQRGAVAAAEDHR